MVQAPPRAALEVIEPELLFQLLVALYVCGGTGSGWFWLRSLIRLAHARTWKMVERAWGFSRDQRER
ncbi:hypothetical protein AW736_23945 [Termitidicoccus mucosus]|uniref:Uncharacterized protein n=1 Tax=Termitidicoccus mucosus TaxID=1184151 RepID=A0A178IBF9_9BACT|nr:hypothetical protein AW736_23945 [Opitutaceae bacterium TSB47]